MVKPAALIFHSGGLGDFVLTWPLALALRRLHPLAELCYVTQPSKGELAERYLASKWVTLDAGGWHDLDSLTPANSMLLERTCCLITFLARPEDAWLREVARRAGGAAMASLTFRPPPDYSRHVTEFHLDQLEKLPELASHYRAAVGEVRRQGLNPQRWPQRILLHPGSGGQHKNWPIERFLELCRRLKTRHPLAWLLGEVELERWPAAVIRALADEAEVVTPPSYCELGRLLEHCSLFIGNDSGPGHLAAMLGVPTLSLFTATPAAVWRPLGPRAHVLHHPQPDVAQVIAAASAALQRAL
jgi:ADP-heptose:LPS heptosyltransferase